MATPRDMSNPPVPVNRATVGIIALVCLMISAVMYAMTASATEQGGFVFVQGGLARIGVLLGALWLALPAQNQTAPWAKISPKTLVIVLLAALLTTRVQLKVLVPAALIVGVLILILRPRPKHRPSDRIAG